MDTYRQQLEQRIEINQRAETDLVFRKEVLDRCYEDSIYWCNNFAFTFDPRKQFYQNIDLPFILWDSQIKVVQWIESLLDNNWDGVLEKSRDLGVSYLGLTPITLYRWLFHDFSALIGSRKEDVVDTPGDPSSLFWKLEYNLRRLPKWMLPDGFEIEKNRNYMRITRPDNSNTIMGESSNDNFGRGGRYNLALFDEFAFWPNAKSAWESAGESATTRLGVSTPPPIGKASYFYKLKISKRAKTYTFHVSADPRKDTIWLKEKEDKMSPEEFEREINISYQGSLEGTVYATEFNTCEFGSFPYDLNRPLYVSWDFGLDQVAMQWYQWDRTTDRWYFIDSYKNSNNHIEFYVPFITGIIKSDINFEYNVSDLRKISNHLNWRKDVTHFGDPDVKKRGIANIIDKSTGRPQSTRDVLQKHGIYVQSKPWAGRSHYDLRQGTLLFLKKLSIDENHNEDAIDAIRLSKYPERSEISQATSAITKPIHDENSHHRTALEYMADNAPSVQRKSNPRSPKRLYSIPNPLS